MNDDGFTSLSGGRRLRKSNPVIAALGELDELNAALGLVRAGLAGHPDAARIESVQRQVLQIGAELATGRPQLAAGAVAALEKEIQRREAALPPLREFVVPGTSEMSARTHLARAVCRRAERALVRAQELHPEQVSPPALAWLNRLSGLLFAWARELESGK